MQQTIINIPHTTGTLNYLGDMLELPYSYATPRTDGKTTQRNLIFAPQNMPVYDLRAAGSNFSLNREGVVLANQASAVKNYQDDNEVRTVAYQEIIDLVMARTGAKRVVITDHTVRMNTGALGATPEGGFSAKTGRRTPDAMLHNDWTTRSGRIWATRGLAAQDSEAVLPEHYALINVWRPIIGPLEDWPLAVADSSSIAFEDLEPVAVIFPERVGELYALRHNPKHRWYYVPKMQTDEVLLFKCYDTMRDGRARFTPHGAFNDLATPADALPRASVEFRALALF